MKRTILDEFITWYIEKREGHGANYLKNNFGDDKAMFRNAITEYRDVFKNAFQYDLFVVDSESSSFAEEIKKRVSDLYDGSSSFARYSAGKSNHMPRAILGGKNLIAFLEEIRTTLNLDENPVSECSPSIQGVERGKSNQVNPADYYQKRAYELWLLDNNLSIGSSRSYVSNLNQLFKALKSKGEIDWGKWVDKGASEIIVNQINTILCLLYDEQTENTLGFELKRLGDIKSALHAYARFLLELSAENEEKCEADSEEEIGSGENAEEIISFQSADKDLFFDAEQIKLNYILRLITQDRPYKPVCFPISVLKKLFYQCPDGKKFFDNWINNHICKIKLHVSRDGQKVITFDKMKELVIRKDQTVKIYGEDGSQNDLYTPLAESEGYEKMKVSVFKDIVIDHIRPMKDILCQNASQLPVLMKITEAMEKINKGPLSGRKNLVRVGNILLANGSLQTEAIGDLIVELQLIGNQTELQLMEKRENSKKSAKM